MLSMSLVIKFFLSKSYNLITSSDKISKLPSLHIYDLNDTWDRIYFPKKLIFSKFDSSTRSFMMN